MFYIGIYKEQGKKGYSKFSIKGEIEGNNVTPKIKLFQKLEYPSLPSVGGKKGYSKKLLD